ncbi:transaldolase family protein [Chromobacterium sp. IIBBL 290-4]|uniref:transaldolase family protein n=1 Tax=Chromobacterium sp. IIBBL 290-4 TaxID=2953890 RepID=UPI0020B68D1E|nr:transaldolase family protein [Chromobacterium sp. IIBBL 290-4]UTH74621.1 hypothetical protein NKT35_00445 [Chromobacterium sp. IIBBL 290-4]
MQIWLDTIDLNLIRHARSLGILAGVTTNPSILSSAERPIEAIAESILDTQQGPLAMQVTRADLDGILAQARNLASRSSRIVVKIPAIGDGFRAMAILEKEGIPTLATTIFEARQIVLAGLIGAHYAAPYLNRIEQSGGDIAKLLEQSQQALQRAGSRTEILGAAIKTQEQFMQCASRGIHAVTLPPGLYQQLFASTPEIDGCLQRFAQAWESNRQACGSEWFQV